MSTEDRNREIARTVAAVCEVMFSPMTAQESEDLAAHYDRAAWYGQDA